MMFYFLFIVQLVSFLLLVGICFTLPGAYLLEKTKSIFNSWEKIILGTVIGLILFSLLSYLLQVIKIHFLLLPLIFAMALLEVRKLPLLLQKITFPSINKLILLLVIFVIGVLGQLLIISPSGINLKGNLVFWSSHGHDGLWHISLMQEYQKGYPLQNPVFAGERVVNYHFFSDIAPADFSEFFKFSNLDLYFRFFPLVYSILLGGLALLLGTRLGKSLNSGIWALFLTLFAGSFGYIVTYIQNKTIGGETVFWASQPQSSIGNPPQIVAFIIVLAFLYLFNFFVFKPEKVLFFICMLLAGSLAVFKIYGGVVLLTSLSLVGLWQLIRERRSHILLLSIASGLLSALLYFPNASNTGSFLIFEPWWFIRTMIVAPNKLNWLDLELRRQTYVADHNYKRVIQLELTGFLIFFFGNLGMRFFGLWNLTKLSKSFFLNYFNQVIVLIMLTSLILPLLVLQKGVAPNTIQFLQYFLILSGIISAPVIVGMLSWLRFRFLIPALACVIILLAVPTQLSLITGFYSRPPFTKITSQELTALQFLKEHTPVNSIILTPAFNKYYQSNDPIPHIWAWSDTGYVAALSAKRTYLADTEQVDIMGYDFKNRLKAEQEIFEQTDPKLFTQQIKSLTVDYLYFPIPQRPKTDLSKTSFIKVFSNPEVEIWKI